MELDNLADFVRFAPARFGLRQTRQILVLHSYRAGYEWTDELARGIRTTFSESGKYELWMEYLEARRIPYPQSAPEFRDYIEKRHRGRKFDLILTTDDEALDFALRHGLAEWSQLPIVFCGVEAGSLRIQLPRQRVTGVLEHFPAVEFLIAAMVQNPGKRRVLVVVDHSPLGRSIATHYRSHEASFPGTRFEYLEGTRMSLEEIKRRVRQAPADSLVLTSQFREDFNGNYVRAEDGEYALAALSPVPVYGPSVSQIGQGIVGGSPNEGFRHGQITTRKAIQILEGARPADLPLEHDQVHRFIYDYPALRRWGISTRLVPEGAEIRNRPSTLWSEYGTWIFAGLLIASFQTAVIGLLIWTNLRRKAVEQQLKVTLEEKQRALEEASRASEMKSRFVANISHEIRTPMNGVLGMLQLLSSSPLREEQREYVALASNSGAALLAILNDILDFSRIEANRLELVSRPFSLRDEMRGLLGLMLPSARSKSLALELDMDPAIPDSLTGDAGRLRQVLLNLISNAVKFTDHGHVRLKLHLVASQADSHTILFRVMDTGIGISPEQVARLFQPFSQVDDSLTRRFGGTGLGLAISQQLVQLMGGRITVSSEAGKGSEFQFQVPFAVFEEPLEVPDIPRAVPQRYESKTVLVVEDHPVNRTVARRLLERFGCQVFVAEDGARALTLLPEIQPDLVFMDVQMPGLSGLEVTSEIRKSAATWGSVPIVAMTARSMAGDRERCLEAGMDGYLSKPLDLLALEDALARYLRN